MGMRWQYVSRTAAPGPGVEMWLPMWETFFAVREWARAAASKAFLKCAVAEHEPTLEETIIGSGWLSHELPNYPQLRWSGNLHDTWDEPDYSTNTEVAFSFPISNDEPFDVRTYPPHRLEAWREDYLDFCEIVRECAPRRRRLGLPPVDACSRWAPCARCRYHPGALLPSPGYWADLEEGEIDRLIRQREEERNLRDETILRARARKSPRTRAGATPRTPPRTRSRSPQVAEDAITLWLHASEPGLPVRMLSARTPV